MVWDTKFRLKLESNPLLNLIYAKMSFCTLRDLRRSAITNWAMHLPIQVVQQLAGHSSINTTRQYYLSVQPEHMEMATKAINSMLKHAESGLTQK